MNLVARLDHVTRKFGATTALNDVSLEIHQGKVLALLGPNGAGKTTAVRILLGLSSPTSGTAELFGMNPRRSGLWGLGSNVALRRTGAMLQVAKVPETLRVREHIELFQSYYPRPLSLAETIELAGLGGIENRKFGELSGGQKQRVLFALALCGDPEMIFLDEPTLGFDVEVRRAFWKQIRAFVARGRTVLLTTHYLEEADALADRIVVIDRGRIVADGSPMEIKSRTSARRIRCETALPEAVLSRLPGVTRVEVDGNRVELLVSIAEPVVRELLMRDEALANLEITGAGLEDAFLALTKQEAA
jgi:ABC-2 type transport system ATP-binding protein